QVRAGSLTTPLKRVIVYKLTSLGIFSITNHFTSERPYHLAVTQVASLTYIYIAALQLPWSIRFYTYNSWYIRLHHERRDHFNNASDSYYDQAVYKHLQRAALYPAVPVLACMRCIFFS